MFISVLVSVLVVDMQARTICIMASLSSTSHRSACSDDSPFNLTQCRTAAQMSSSIHNKHNGRSRKHMKTVWFVRTRGIPGINPL